MQPPPETTLRALRRLRGRQKGEAAKMGLSARTLRSAELRIPVSAATRKRLEAEFNLPWQSLMSDWLDEVTSE
jgi:hypothetical protein